MPEARIRPTVCPTLPQPRELPDTLRAPVREEVFFVSINRDRSCLVTSTPDAETAMEPGENAHNSVHWGQYQVKLAKRLQSIAPAYPGAPYSQRYVGLVPTLLKGRLAQAEWMAQVLRPLRAAAQAANADVNKRYHVLKHNPFRMRSSLWNWPVRVLVLLIPIFCYHITWDHGLHVPQPDHELPLPMVPRKSLGDSWLWIFKAAFNVIRALVGLPIILAGVLLAFIAGFAVDAATLRLLYCCASREQADAWVADRLSRQPELDSAAIDRRVFAAVAKVTADLAALTGLAMKCDVHEPDDDDAGRDDDQQGRSYFGQHKTKRFRLHGRVPVDWSSRGTRWSDSPGMPASHRGPSSPAPAPVPVGAGAERMSTPVSV